MRDNELKSKTFGQKNINRTEWEPWQSAHTMWNHNNIDIWVMVDRNKYHFGTSRKRKRGEQQWGTVLEKTKPWREANISSEIVSTVRVNYH